VLLGSIEAVLLGSTGAVLLLGSTSIAAVLLGATVAVLLAIGSDGTALLLSSGGTAAVLLSTAGLLAVLDSTAAAVEDSGWTAGAVLLAAEGTCDPVDEGSSAVAAVELNLVSPPPLLVLPPPLSAGPVDESPPMPLAGCAKEKDVAKRVAQCAASTPSTFDWPSPPRRPRSVPPLPPAANAAISRWAEPTSPGSGSRSTASGGSSLRKIVARTEACVAERLSDGYSTCSCSVSSWLCANSSNGICEPESCQTNARELWRSTRRIWATSQPSGPAPGPVEEEEEGG